MCHAVQWNVPLIEFQKILMTDIELRSIAQSHFCFPLCLMGSPQPRDGSSRTAVRRSGWDFWTCTETCTAESTATHAPSSSSTTWPNVRLCWPGYVNDSCCHMHLFPVLREQNMLTLCFLSRLVLSHALRADLERSSYLQGLWAALKICKCRLCKWGSWPCSKWSCFVIFSG